MHSKLWTTFGWELHVTADTKIKTLRNFLMQANAAEMLRLACYRFVEQGGFDKGFLLAGPVHDALLVETSADTMDEAEAFTRSIMESASRTVLKGHTLGVDVKRWRYPQRYMDEKRGRPTWNRIMGYLHRAELGRRIQNEPGPFCIRYRIQNDTPVLSPLSP